MSNKKFSYTPEQSAAIKHRGSALLVSAAAGSGKTKVLVERLLSRVEEGDNIDRFLVITYTRAAASELRGKIYDEILDRLSDAPENRRLRRQSMLCRGAPIGTIHSFCTEILRENAHLAKLPPDFRVADESEAEMIKAEVLDNILSQAYENAKDDSFRKLVDMVSRGRDDRRLITIIHSLHAKLQSNPSPSVWVEKQKQMLKLTDVTDISETIWGAYLIGKALSTAVFWKSEIEKVASEMISLPDFEKAYGASIEATISSLGAFVGALNISWDEAKRHSDIDFPNAKPVKGYEDLKDIRTRCKAAMKKCSAIFECSSQEHIEDMRAVAEPMTSLLNLILEFDSAYAQEKRRRAAVDFSDLEHLTLSLLLDSQTGERTNLAKSIAQRYKEIMVDEYQDVNAVQELIFNAVSQDGGNIFMVGDVKQSIYRFRLADPSIFLDKYRRFDDERSGGSADASALRTGYAGSGGENADGENSEGAKILLSQNFRSRPEILEGVNFVFEKIMQTQFGEMEYTGRERLVPGRADVNSCDAPGVPVELNIIDMKSQDTDDDEESPAKTQIEAKYIADKIAKLTDGTHFMPDGEGGSREIGYSDIVILLRSVRGKAWQYAAALSERDIPVDMPGGEGFFETFEISAALSLLEVIDNPMQDIPLAAALSGPAYEFSADELAEIRAQSQSADFFSALQDIAQKETQQGIAPMFSSALSLSGKCAAFLSEVDGMRLVMPDMPADRFIWHVYNKTGLLERVGAMRGGAKRRGNLVALAESARTFEQNGYKGLFGFLTYVHGLRERGAELIHDGAGADGADESDAVKIMSIHKSKGLEFPVVIIADSSKQLNNKDAQQSLVIHPKFGLGAMRMDMQRRIEYTTIARMAVGSKLTSEMMAEELRVLYVAMTRAREKLIITATFRDAEKELGKFFKFGKNIKNIKDITDKAAAGTKIAPQLLEDIKSMAGWILAAHASVPDGNETIAVSVADTEAEPESLETGSKAPVTPPGPAPESPYAIAKTQTFAYPHHAAPELPSKLTVTGLKGLNDDPEAAVLNPETDIGAPENKRKERLAHTRPGFITERKGLTAAERGIALHLTLQHIDFQKCVNMAGVAEEIERLTKKGLLKKEQAETIDAEKIITFFESDIGKRILAAESIKREFKFSLLYPAEYFFPNGGQDKIMLQGVVDCFFEQDGELTIVDFKTDVVTPETLGEKVKLYAPQLEAYSNALERITKRPVKERVIYFFYINRAMSV